MIIMDKLLAPIMLFMYSLTLTIGQVPLQDSWQPGASESGIFDSPPNAQPYYDREDWSRLHPDSFQDSFSELDERENELNRNPFKPNLQSDIESFINSPGSSFRPFNDDPAPISQNGLNIATLTDEIPSASQPDKLQPPFAIQPLIPKQVEVTTQSTTQSSFEVPTSNPDQPTVKPQPIVQNNPSLLFPSRPGQPLSLAQPTMLLPPNIRPGQAFSLPQPSVIKPQESIVVDQPLKVLQENVGQQNSIPQTSQGKPVQSLAGDKLELPLKIQPPSVISSPQNKPGEPSSLTGEKQEQTPPISLFTGLNPSEIKPGQPLTIPQSSVLPISPVKPGATSSLSGSKPTETKPGQPLTIPQPLVSASQNNPGATAPLSGSKPTETKPGQPLTIPQPLVSSATQNNPGATAPFSGSKPTETKPGQPLTIPQPLVSTASQDKPGATASLSESKPGQPLTISQTLVLSPSQDKPGAATSLSGSKPIETKPGQPLTIPQPLVSSASQDKLGATGSLSGSKPGQPLTIPQTLVLSPSQDKPGATASLSGSKPTETKLGQPLTIPQPLVSSASQDKPGAAPSLFGSKPTETKPGQPLTIPQPLVSSASQDKPGATASLSGSKPTETKPGQPLTIAQPSILAASQSNPGLIAATSGSTPTETKSGQPLSIPQPTAISSSSLLKPITFPQTNPSIGDVLNGLQFDTLINQRGINLSKDQNKPNGVPVQTESTSLILGEENPLVIDSKKRPSNNILSQIPTTKETTTTASPAGTQQKQEVAPNFDNQGPIENQMPNFNMNGRPINLPFPLNQQNNPKFPFDNLPNFNIPQNGQFVNPFSNPDNNLPQKLVNNNNNNFGRPIFNMPRFGTNKRR